MKLESALACIEKGWAVFPVAPNAKHPLTKNGFKDATKSAYAVRQWWTQYPDANIGIATGEASGIIVVDVDVKNGAKGMESLGTFKDLPYTLHARTPSGGLHLYFLAPGPIKSRIGLLPGIDLKADGGYVLAPGSVIDDKAYEWLDKEAPISEPVQSFLSLTISTNGSGPHHKLENDSLIPEGARNATLASLAGSMRRRGMSFEEILAALLVVNSKRCQPPLPESEVKAIAASIAKYPAEDSTPAAEAPAPEGPPGEDEAVPPEFTEDALALEFTGLYAQDWRYVAAWGWWLHWDGACWRRETTLKAYDLARLICREASARCLKIKIAAKVASAATVAAVERLSRADRRHAAITEQWDCDFWLLNTPSNVVEILTGKARPHSREDYMTKITAASPGEHCPTWLRFLGDVTNGDVELQRYLARMAGYCLTGVTSEHVLFFLYGTGANGKSVFVNTLAAIMGDYATSAPIDTFIETKGDRHPTDLASFRGARLVTCIEVDKGRRWAEAKIKSLTGGDKIAARFMRQDFFEYKPQFKLVIAGNHKPSLRDADEAMRRRLHLVPFTVTIPMERRDKTLPDRLLEEKDGILGWMIQGCLEWQKIGLKPPASVLAATEEYFESQDALGRWVSEECQLNPQAVTLTSELYQSWKAWAEKWGEYVTSMKKFSEDLAKRGFKKRRLGGKGNIQFQGIAIGGQAVEEVLL